MLSHSQGFEDHIPPLPPNPTPVDQAAFATVTADLATVKADQTSVHSDRQAVEAAPAGGTDHRAGHDRSSSSHGCKGYSPTVDPGGSCRHSGG